MKLPCPRCAKPATCGVFCRDCIREVHPLLLGSKTPKLVLCASCDRVRPFSDWKHMTLDDAIIKVLSPALQLSSEAIVCGVEFETPDFVKKPGIKRSVKVLCVITGHHEQAKTDYEEEHEVTLDYEVTLCPSCSKKGSAYYEGILQIRNATPEVRGVIAQYFSKHKEKGLRLAKQVPVGAHGEDYYISDQRAVGHLAKQLHVKYGGELRVAAQHFSYDHAAGKNLYRVNAYLEIPEFAKGDVIRIGDAYYYVLGIRDTVKCENLNTGQVEQMAYRKGEPVRLPIKTTQIVNTKPLEVLHPKTYAVVSARASQYADVHLGLDEEVSVAYDGKEVFIIPPVAEKEEVKKKKKRHSQKRKTKDDDLINPN